MGNNKPNAKRFDHGGSNLSLERRAAEKKHEFSESIRCVPEFNMRSPYIQDSANYRRVQQHRLQLAVDKLPCQQRIDTTADSRRDSSVCQDLMETRLQDEVPRHHPQDPADPDNRRRIDHSSRSDSGTSAPDVYQSHSLSEKLL